MIILKKTNIHILLGLVILLIVLVVNDPKKILITWSDYDFLWLIPATISILLSTILGCYNIFIIFNQGTSIQFRTFLPIYWKSWAVGLIVPGQVGDVVAMTYWLNKKGFSWKEISVFSVVDKILTLFWILLFAIIGLFFLISDYHIQINPFCVGTIVILCVLIISSIIVLNLKEKLANVISNNLKLVRNTVARSRKAIILNFALTPIKIILISIAYMSVFKAAGTNLISLLLIVPLVSLSSLISYIPISFNGIGTVEFAAITIFGSLGLEPSTILSVFLSLRVLVILLAWLPGILVSIPNHSTDTTD